jgi:hypothetical protein
MSSQANRPDTMIPTRRRFLAVVSAAGAVSTASNGFSAAPSPKPDVELLGLKAEFDPLFDLWCAMTIEQGADCKEFEALLREKTGMTRAEADVLDRDDPEWEAYHQTLYAEVEARPDKPEAWEPVRDRFYELADEILAYDAATREGLALQARAFISAYSEVYDDYGADGTSNFLVSVCAFVGVQFPPAAIGEAQS